MLIAKAFSAALAVASVAIALPSKEARVTSASLPTDHHAVHFHKKSLGDSGKIEIQSGEDWEKFKKDHPSIPKVFFDLTEAIFCLRKKTDDKAPQWIDGYCVDAPKMTLANAEALLFQFVDLADNDDAFAEAGKAIFELDAMELSALKSKSDWKNKGPALAKRISERKLKLLEKERKYMEQKMPHLAQMKDPKYHSLQEKLSDIKENIKERAEIIGEPEKNLAFDEQNLPYEALAELAAASFVSDAPPTEHDGKGPKITINGEPNKVGKIFNFLGGLFSGDPAKVIVAICEIVQQSGSPCDPNRKSAPKDEV
ncbi:uncharacterized protein CTRU02_206950 [Colletotrichum truncatum]|uniref:Uncharacterized protein n=1 Tax=Colletotrichum truncatum TaxID=5467 RepID=A0ACC3YZ42_COLTU|nr:uncharacterized protein CTRU02_11196 [Colletotrichum truncatum]KAF6786325.1 hypothetical protein CTRU02_11196 [Colletotrichum truncatum]